MTIKNHHLICGICLFPQASTEHIPLPQSIWERNKLMRYPRIGGARPEACEEGLEGQEDIQQSIRGSFLHFVCLYPCIYLGIGRSNLPFLCFFSFASENNDAGCENSRLCSSVHFRAIESIVGKWGNSVKTLQKAQKWVVIVLSLSFVKWRDLVRSHLRYIERF